MDVQKYRRKGSEWSSALQWNTSASTPQMPWLARACRCRAPLCHRSTVMNHKFIDEEWLLEISKLNYFTNEETKTLVKKIKEKQQQKTHNCPFACP
jgi:hypothetical protein